MKLRIRGDSIRLRLTRQEVVALGESGEVAERTHFADGIFLEYRLRSDSESNACVAVFHDNVLTVSVAAELAARWVHSEEVAVGCEDSGPLRILIEKDFACLSERQGEDDSDAFPHPPKC